MLAYTKAWPARVWAVEGANGAGRPLAQRLLEAGEVAVDVPAKLAARVRLFDTGLGRKTDAHDAHSIAVVAVRSTGLRVLTVDGELQALRMLDDRRDALSRRRVQTAKPAARVVGGTDSGTGEEGHHSATGQGPARHGAPRVTSPGRPAGGSPPRSWPSWLRSTPRSRSPPPSSRPWSWPEART